MVIGKAPGVYFTHFTITSNSAGDPVKIIYYDNQIRVRIVDVAYNKEGEVDSISIDGKKLISFTYDESLNISQGTAE